MKIKIFLLSTTLISNLTLPAMGMNYPTAPTENFGRALKAAQDDENNTCRELSTYVYNFGKLMESVSALAALKSEAPKVGVATPDLLAHEAPAQHSLTHFQRQGPRGRSSTVTRKPGFLGRASVANVEAEYFAALQPSHTPVSSGSDASSYVVIEAPKAVAVSSLGLLEAYTTEGISSYAAAAFTLLKANSIDVAKRKNKPATVNVETAINLMTDIIASLDPDARPSEHNDVLIAEVKKLTEVIKKEKVYLPDAYANFLFQWKKGAAKAADKNSLKQSLEELKKTL